MKSSKDKEHNRLIGMKFPSITDPCRLKYQEIWLTVFPEQWRAGVNPWFFFKKKKMITKKRSTSWDQVNFSLLNHFPKLKWTRRKCVSPLRKVWFLRSTGKYRSVESDRIRLVIPLDTRTNLNANLEKLDNGLEKCNSLSQRIRRPQR